LTPSISWNESQPTTWLRVRRTRSVARGSDPALEPDPSVPGRHGDPAAREDGQEEDEQRHRGEHEEPRDWGHHPRPLTADVGVADILQDVRPSEDHERRDRRHIEEERGSRGQEPREVLRCESHHDEGGPPVPLPETG